ncbi:ParB N-terminal domain-containing protein [Endozoicomonas sp. YOMI1]|uniref:ParB N-terminal domain-containing protein n=1 Tax=Endozoicomonas sp. YOMI1 TaxID=2828739 RepID=UPI00214960ED|nr:ParB N-terminal domain-containing protein [Endozoicomonas sp. YOMI1]
MAAKKYKMVEKKVSDLIPYVNNSRVHDEEQIIQICSSIQEFGFTNPVLIDEEKGVVLLFQRQASETKTGARRRSTATPARRMLRTCSLSTSAFFKRLSPRSLSLKTWPG